MTGERQHGRRLAYDDQALKILGSQVRSRRLELQLAQSDLMARGGPSAATVRSIEHGKPVKARTYRGLEQALDWAEGSVKGILGGETPVLVCRDEQPISDNDKEKLTRLVSFIRLRRRELGLSAKEFAEFACWPPGTARFLEQRPHPYISDSRMLSDLIQCYSLAADGLGWTPESVDSILRGGEPTIREDFDPALPLGDWGYRRRQLGVGLTIRNLRENEGWSVDELGRRAKIPLEVVKKIEQGEEVESGVIETLQNTLLEPVRRRMNRLAELDDIITKIEQGLKHATKTVHHLLDPAAQADRLTADGGLPKSALFLIERSIGNLQEGRSHISSVFQAIEALFFKMQDRLIVTHKNENNGESSSEWPDRS